jgi:cytochrome b561
MRLSWPIAVVLAAIVVAAGVLAHGGLYQFVGTGPDSGYLIHRLTGQVWYVTGTTRQPVVAAPPKFNKEFGK